MMVQQLHVMVRNTMRGMYTEQRGPVCIIECMQVSIDCDDVFTFGPKLQLMINDLGIGTAQIAGPLYSGEALSLQVFPTDGRPKTSAQLAYEIGRAAEQILATSSELVSS